MAQRPQFPSLMMNPDAPGGAMETGWDDLSMVPPPPPQLEDPGPAIDFSATASPAAGEDPETVRSREAIPETRRPAGPGAAPKPASQAFGAQATPSRPSTPSPVSAMAPQPFSPISPSMGNAEAATARVRPPGLYDQGSKSALMGSGAFGGGMAGGLLGGGLGLFGDAPDEQTASPEVLKLLKMLGVA